MEQITIKNGSKENSFLNLWFESLHNSSSKHKNLQIIPKWDISNQRNEDFI